MKIKDIVILGIIVLLSLFGLADLDDDGSVGY